MEMAKKGGNPNKPDKFARKDRRSATGMSGDPKKGGRGGKFTWDGPRGHTDEDDEALGKGRKGTKDSGEEEAEEGEGEGEGSGGGGGWGGKQGKQ